MKKLFYLVCLAGLTSCEQPKPVKSGVKRQQPLNSKYNSLFELYPNIAIDTLWVYSPDSANDVYQGRAIDSVNALFFPQEMAKQHFNEPGFFAIYKFAIDQNRLALLTRTPSEYEPSSIKLFIYDRRNDSLGSYIELGEKWGDAGDWMIRNSWLFRDTSNRLQAFIDVTRGHDNSVDDANDTTTVEKDYFTLLDLSKDKIDTIFADKEELPEKYIHLARLTSKKVKL
ncbi:hypothetical protein [Longitalea luteola]|uniref:hypothetical protein n=1 Tax=Longitalea luteola TaxID=2812563 RepID=UPI001A9582F4|nr:hypothetical protein [Longitalea luteola]